MMIFDTATILAVVSGLVIPALSALATRAPSFWTGVITAVLAAASGFVSEWAQHPNNYDWQHGALIALGALFTAWGAHSKIYKGTRVEKRLYNAGRKA